ncbi:translocon-associated protein subunit delta-like [Coccinella septempunctata]|uniref:translocon-associated protein subunit delta-like n=1 Tax=Coccinella septempunctata TaxID=41139 RepID=UPI001D077090|nr:translocon-associated protein subunit delta-like [Coccinella septempunctata]
MFKFVNFAFFFACLNLAFSETCKNPVITSHSFTTQDSTYLTNIAYIGVFEVKCENDGILKNIYADLNGNIAPVSTVDKNKFQVSWTEDIKKASSGDKVVRIYNEDDVATLRKAQRSGEDINSVPALGSIVVNHPGTYNGPLVNGEFLALVVASVTVYYAIVSKLQITC